MTSPRAREAASSQALTHWAYEVPIRRHVRYSRTPDGGTRERGVSVIVQRGVLQQLAALSTWGTGAGAWPAERTLAIHLGCNVRTIRAAIRGLQAQGLVELERLGGGRISSRYVLTLKRYGCGVHLEPVQTCLHCHRRRQKSTFPQERGRGHGPAQGGATAPPTREVTPLPPKSSPSAPTPAGSTDTPSGAATPHSPRMRQTRPKGCDRHRRRAKPACPACNPTPTPARYVAPAVPDANHAAGAAAARAAAAAAGARFTPASTKPRRDRAT